MSEERTPRTNTTRTVEQRPTDSWKPASILPDPKPQDGYVFRWIKTALLGQSDNTHVSKMFREGWEPVRADEYPDSTYPTMADGKYAGVIGVGGLLLARIPEELAKSREAYFQQVTQDRNDALDNDVLKEQHPSMPINQDRQTRVTFGGTKKN